MSRPTARVGSQSFLLEDVMTRKTSLLLSAALTVATLGLGTATGVSAATPTPVGCAALTKAVLVHDGFTAATGPVVTPYNYKKASANQTNAIGTTIDFGAKAIVISCVSPADIAAVHPKNTPTATAYMASIVKDSAGAMVKKMVGGVADYLDFGNGKEDGLGSMSKAAGLRLDAWVAGRYLVFADTTPASVVPSKALLNFIATTISTLR
jgi:hypothetical protein